MPTIGPLELLVILIIALVVFGPKRLPELGASLGRGIREFRSTVSGIGEENHEQADQHQEKNGQRRELNRSDSAADPETVDGEIVGEKRD